MANRKGSQNKHLMKYWQHLGEAPDEDDDHLYEAQEDDEAHMRFIQGTARIEDRMIDKNKKQKRVQFMEDSLESSIYDDRNADGTPAKQPASDDHELDEKYRVQGDDMSEDDREGTDENNETEQSVQSVADMINKKKMATKAGFNREQPSVAAPTFASKKKVISNVTVVKPYKPAWRIGRTKP